MAFDIKGLELIGGMKGSTPQVWIYKTSDDWVTVVTMPGYFDNGATTVTGVRNLFEVGDSVDLHCSVDSTPTLNRAQVVAITDGVVETALR